MREEFADVHGEIAEVRTEMREEFAQVRTDVAGIRSDLTYVALAVGAKPRRNTS